MTIITDQSEYLINVGDCVSEPKELVFRSKDSVIKFGLFKGKDYLGLGEMKVNNEIHWITINSMPSHKHNDSTKYKGRNIRLRVKCSNRTANDLLSLSSSSIEKEFSTCFDQSKPYLKPKIGKLFHNRSCESNIMSSLLNTEINTSRQSYHQVYNYRDRDRDSHINDNTNTCNGNSNAVDDRSLCLSLSNSKIDFQIRTAQKKITSKPNKDEEYKSDLEEQIVDKAYENNIKNDEMIMNSNTKPNEYMNGNDECLLKSSDEIDSSIKAFERIKEDFFILYDDAFLSEVTNETIVLETELFIEKYSDMELKYHRAMNQIKEQIDYYKSLIKHFHSFCTNLIKMKNKFDIESLQNEDNANANTHMFHSNIEEMKMMSNIIINVSHKKGFDDNKLKFKLTKAVLNDVIQSLFAKPNKRHMIEKLNVYQKFVLDKFITKAAITHNNNKHNKSNEAEVPLCYTQRDPISTIERKEKITIRTKMSPFITHKSNRVRSVFEGSSMNLSRSNINVGTKVNNPNNNKALKSIIATTQRSKAKYYSTSKYK